MNIIKYLLLVGCVCFATTLINAQPKDTKTKSILEILELLDEEEQAEIVMHAHSQRDIPPQEELTWLLANMDDSAKTRILKYIERKAGSRIKPKEGTADIYWLESSHDFGKIQEGKFYAHKFEFENIGEEPYIIQTVEGSCGCTIANYPKEPIPAGGKGIITVQFNSKGKKGDNTEFVTIIGNSQPKHVSLIIEAVVY
jgi:hypothetical protein